MHNLNNDDINELIDSLEEQEDSVSKTSVLMKEVIKDGVVYQLHFSVVRSKEEFLKDGELAMYITTEMQFIPPPKNRKDIN